MREICHETGIAAIMVIHDLNLALRFCDRFLLMQDGAVFRYGDDRVIDREAIWQVYGVHGETAEIRGRKMVLVDEM